MFSWSPVSSLTIPILVAFFAISSGLLIDVYAQSSTFGSNGDTNGEFRNPVGVAANSTHVLVTDTVKHNVQIFDLDGNYVSQLGSGTRSTADGEFDAPRGVAINSTHILVVDTGNRVQIFDLLGNYVSQFGDSIDGDTLSDGELLTPQGIAINSTHILVADRGNNIVQIFDHSGNYVADFGTRAGHLGAGLTGDGNLSGPRYIALTDTNILVTDRGNERVQIFDHSGNYVSQFGSSGDGDGEFDDPTGIALTSTHILVTDERNHRIQTFTLAGTYVSQFGSSGSGNDQFNRPAGITINGDNVFVVDTRNDRVHKIALSTATGATSGPPTFSSAGTTSPTTIDVIASEPLTGTPVIGDFTVSSNTVSTATISGSTITITVNTAITSTDTVTVALTGTSVTDLAGNALTFTAQSVTNNVSVPPTVTEVTTAAPAQSYRQGEGVPITVTFSEPITVTGTPQLTLDIGGTLVPVGLDRTEGDSQLIFRYVVAAGHNTDDFNYAGTDSLALNGGTIVATTGGAAADLMLPTPASSGLAGIAIIVDTTAPTVAISSNTADNDGTTGSATVSYTATFSEATTDFILSDITVSGTAQGGSPVASNFAGSGTTYTFDVVTTSDGTVVVSIPASSATDAAGNQNAVSNTYTVTINTATLSVSISSTTAADSSTNSATISYTATFSGTVTDFVLGDITVTGTAQGGSPVASNFAGSGTDYTFDVVTTSDGTVIVSISAGVATEGSNTNIASNTYTVTIDTTAPTFSSAGTTSTTTIDVIASEPLAGTPAIGDFTIPGNIVSTATISGSTITITVNTAITSADTVTVALTGTSVTDQAGNALAFAAQTVTNNVPKVTSTTYFTFGSLGTGNGQFNNPVTITSNSTHILVADSSNDRIQIFDHSGNYNSQFGSSGTGDGMFTQPRGITTNSTHILVADTVNDRIQTFDLDGNHVHSFGSTGTTGNGQFNFPQRIIVNATHILVADTANNRIQIFDLDGNYISQFGSAGAGNGQFNTPRGIAVSSTHILVVDSLNNRIQIFDHSGNYVNQFGSAGAGDGQFDDPSGIAVTATHILVADTDNDRIQTFDLDGNHVGSFGSSGTNNGQFDDPTDMTISGDNVFVADATNNRVHAFSLSALLSTPAISSVTSTGGPYNTGDTVPITVSFSESVTITGTPQLTLETGTADAVVDYTSGSPGAALTFTYTVTAGHNSNDLNYVGTDSLSLNSGTIVSTVGGVAAVLTLPATTSAQSLGGSDVVIDTVAPTFSSAGTTSTTTIDVIASESLTGTPTIADFTVSGNTVSAATISDTTITITVNTAITSTDTVTVALSGTSVTDQAGNALAFAAQTVTNNVQPAPTVTSVTSTGGPYNTGDTVPIIVTFSESVTITGTPQLTLETGTTDAVVDYTSGSPGAALTFTYTVAAGHNSNDLNYVGTDSLSLNSGSIAATTGGVAAVLTLPAITSAQSLGGSDVVIDTVAPTFSSAETTSETTIVITASESLTGTPVGGDFTLTGNTFSSATISGSTITITVGTAITNTDAITVALGGTFVTDLAGNALTFTAQTVSNNVAAGPSVSSVTATGGPYNTGDTVPIIVTFSESVTITGTPQLTLETGTTDAIVDYASGSPGAALTFTYTVAAGHNSDDLNYVGTDSLSLNSGSIAATTGGVAAVLTLPAITSAQSLGGSDVVIDTVAPTFSSAGTTSETTIDVIASESLAGTPAIGDFTIPGNTVSTATISGSTITITVNTAITSTDTVTVALTGTSVTDLAGNALAFTAQSVTNNVLATPTVTEVTTAAPVQGYSQGEGIPVIVRFSESVDTTGTPQLTLNIGGTMVPVDIDRGSGTTDLVFRYVVAAGHNTDDFNYAGTDSLGLNGGTIVATTGGAAADLTLPSPSSSGLAGIAIIVDTTAPTVALSSSTAAGSTTNSAITYTATFSEDVTGFDAVSDITLSGTATATAAAPTGSGTTYNFVVTASTDGTVIASIPANAATDAADNGNTVSSTYTVTADVTAPTFSSAGTTSTTTIDVIASESLTGTPAIGDFTVSGNTVSAATISDTTITITVNTAITSTDTVTVALTGTSVTDLAGNALTFTAQSVTNNVSAGLSVSSVTSSGGPYNTGDTVPIIVTFSESVTVTGTPQLTLETGTTDAIVDYASGSPGAALTFTYTVESGHNSDDLNYVGTDSLSLNSGSIAATTGGAAAVLTLPAITSAQSLGGSDVVIDTVAPTFSSAETTSETTIVITASESLTGTPTIGDFTIPGNTVSAASISGNTITITVNTAITSTDTVTVALTGTSVTDLAGNALAFTAQSVTYNVSDTTAPLDIVRGIVTGTGIVEITTNVALDESSVTATSVTMTVGGTAADITDRTLVAGNNIIITTSNTLLSTDAIIVTLTAVTDLAGNTLTDSYTLTAQDKGLLGMDNTVSITDTDNVFVIQDTIPANSILVVETGTSVNATLDLSRILNDPDDPNAGAVIPVAFSITRPGITIELQATTLVSDLPDSNQILLSSLARTPQLPPTARIDAQVEIGSPDLDITLNNPARITFSGLAGSTPYYVDSAGATTVINTPCGGDSDATTGITDGECQIVSGNDLIVWTYHFTTFGAFGVETSGGSGGNIAQSRPHFGLSPLTDTQLVSCGFSMDGECRDVVDYHVPYDRTVIQTGTTHDFTLKPFNNYNLKMLQLGLGVEEVGDSINTAEALITVELAPDYKSDIGYTIESVNTENNLENVIDEVTESNVSLSTEQCMAGLEKDCLVVHINDVMFRDVFYSEPFVINVIDTKRLSSTNYLNEGIIVTGESLNPAPEYHLTTGKKVEQAVERLNLVRTDKVNDIWTDDNGNKWTQNNHDTWIQVTFTPYVEPKDPTMSVMTRINNNFDDMILLERERAILVWDSTVIQGEIKPSFSYTFDERLDKLDDPKILKKLDIESEKALEILRAANYNFQDE